MLKSTNHRRFEVSSSKKVFSDEKMEKEHPYQDRLYKLLDKVWDMMPGSFGTFVATVIIFIAGTSMRGDWLLILVYFIKQFSGKPGNDSKAFNSPVRSAEQASAVRSPLGFALEEHGLQHLTWYMIVSYAISFIFYFSVCGFLQWYFYIRQKDRPEDWKCQPRKFLTWEDERHEILLGTLGVGIGSTISGILSCYVMNGGYSTIYFRLDEYGWTYLILSLPGLFLFIDAGNYYLHRIHHLPFLYKHIHKWHHRYKQPTAFSASAFHPLDFLSLQAILVCPIFLFPIHWAVYMSVLFYAYYYGITAHSGIIMSHIWPWQPSSYFHDKHHEFFHTNFGFNTTIWDRIHGTMRQENRLYNENIFYGFGKSWEDASQEEKEEYLKAQDEANT